jgi:hypothetical protein
VLPLPITLVELAKHNRVQLIWVPRREGIAGNETADQFAKIGAEHPFIGLEPACTISIGVASMYLSYSSTYLRVSVYLGVSIYLYIDAFIYEYLSICLSIYLRISVTL